jgi:hypothetical protein
VEIARTSRVENATRGQPGDRRRVGIEAPQRWVGMDLNADRDVGEAQLTAALDSQGQRLLTQGTEHSVRVYDVSTEANSAPTSRSTQSPAPQSTTTDSKPPSPPNKAS